MSRWSVISSMLVIVIGILPSVAFGAHPCQYCYDQALKYRKEYDAWHNGKASGKTKVGKGMWSDWGKYDEYKALIDKYADDYEACEAGRPGPHGICSPGAGGGGGAGGGSGDPLQEKFEELYNEIMEEQRERMDGAVEDMRDSTSGLDSMDYDTGAGGQSFDGFDGEFDEFEDMSDDSLDGLSEEERALFGGSGGDSEEGAGDVGDAEAQEGPVIDGSGLPDVIDFDEPYIPEEEDGIGDGGEYEPTDVYEEAQTNELGVGGVRDTETREGPVIDGSGLPDVIDFDEPYVPAEDALAADEGSDHIADSEGESLEANNIQPNYGTAGSAPQPSQNEGKAPPPTLPPRTSGTAVSEDAAEQSVYLDRDSSPEVKDAQRRRILAEGEQGSTYVDKDSLVHQDIGTSNDGSIYRDNGPPSTTNSSTTQGGKKCYTCSRTWTVTCRPNQQPEGDYHAYTRENTFVLRDPGRKEFTDENAQSCCSEMDEYWRTSIPQKAEAACRAIGMSWDGSTPMSGYCGATRKYCK